MFLILFRNILRPQQMFPSLRAQGNVRNKVPSFVTALRSWPRFNGIGRENNRINNRNHGVSPENNRGSEEVREYWAYDISIEQYIRVYSKYNFLACRNVVSNEHKPSPSCFFFTTSAV